MSLAAHRPIVAKVDQLVDRVADPLETPFAASRATAASFLSTLVAERTTA